MMSKLQTSIRNRDLDARDQFHDSEGAVESVRGNATLRPIPVFQKLLGVLVVDDCRDAADSLAMLVKLWGHKVRVAYDGAAALVMIGTSQPDVVLLDIGMPKMNGYQLAQRLHGPERSKDALLIAMTGYADNAHRLLWEGAFDHYLIKPVDPSILGNLLMLEHDRLERLSEAPATGVPCKLPIVQPRNG